MKNETELALNTFIKLLRAESSVQKALSLSNGVTNDLTQSQFGVLEALLHKGDLSSKELSLSILKTKGNMTMVIDNLVKKGLVARKYCQDDRRKKYITLTVEGRDLIEDIFPRHAREITNCFKVLSREEQKTLGALCKKLGTGLKEY